MATKLRKLQINEVSLCDAGANQHARVTLFKRDREEDGRYGSAPKDHGRDFKAGGNGPATDALWVSFDNYRRSMPGRAQAAFALAWSELADGEKQAIRDEEAAAAAREAAARAKQNERQNQMSDEGMMIKAAHAIARGELSNTVRRSSWHTELRKMAAERQEAGESVEQSVARLVRSDPDALALFKASLSGVVADAASAAPVTPAPVIKSDSAYAQLRKIADGICEGNPSLSRHAAFLQAYTANPDLAKASKSEQAFT
jgi:hypothetical protein